MSEDLTGKREGGSLHQSDQSKSEIIDVYGPLMEPEKVDVIEFELLDGSIMVTDGQERVFGYEESFGTFRRPTQEELDEFNKNQDQQYWFSGHEGYIIDEYFV